MKTFNFSLIIGSKNDLSAAESYPSFKSMININTVERITVLSILENANLTGSATPRKRDVTDRKERQRTETAMTAVTYRAVRQVDTISCLYTIRVPTDNGLKCPAHFSSENRLIARKKKPFSFRYQSDILDNKVLRCDCEALLRVHQTHSYSRVIVAPQSVENSSRWISGSTGQWFRKLLFFYTSTQSYFFYDVITNLINLARTLDAYLRGKNLSYFYLGNQKSSV